MNFSLLISADSAAQRMRLRSYLLECSAKNLFHQIRLVDTNHLSEVADLGNTIIFQSEKPSEQLVPILQSLSKKSARLIMLIAFSSYSTAELNRFYKAGCKGVVHFGEGSSAFDEAIRKRMVCSFLKEGRETTHLNGATFRFPLPSPQAYDVVVIGSSTGGVEGVEEIIENLPDQLPCPIVVAQHLSVSMLFNFVERLDRKTSNKVVVPQEGEPLLASTVYVLPAHQNTIILRSREKAIFKKSIEVSDHFNNPSIDLLFQSASENFGKKTVGILLSGMGKDGVEGLGSIQKNKGETIVQKPSSSTISKGMPLAAIQKGCVNHIFSVTEMIEFINSLAPVTASN